MIKLNITSRHLEEDNKVVPYARKKIGSLDRYLPRNSRNGIHGTLTLENDPSGREGNQYICEVVLNLPGKRVVVSKEATVNIYAAIDIVEAKLRAQLSKYKDKQIVEGRRSTRLLLKIIGRGTQEPESAEA